MATVIMFCIIDHCYKLLLYLLQIIINYMIITLFVNKAYVSVFTNIRKNGLIHTALGWLKVTPQEQINILMEKLS